MQRFLDSLQVVTNSSSMARKDIEQSYEVVENQYRTVSRNARSQVFRAQNPKKARQCTTYSYQTKARSFHEMQNSQPVHYTPAPRYPAPMQPRLFKPALPDFNAQRVAKLSNYHPPKVSITDQTPEDNSPELPPLHGEKINIVLDDDFY